MANQRGQGMSITPVDFSASGTTSVLSSVGAVADRTGETGAAVFGSLGARVGALADQLAESEGRRAGLVAGTDPGFRPTEGFTIRDRAFDRAASDTYLSTLTARFHSDALDVAEAHRADPAGLKTAYDDLVATYRRRDVFPEIHGAFQDQAIRLGTTMRRAALDQWHAKVDDQQRATLLDNMATRERDAQRILSLDPHAPEAEANVFRLRDQTIADIRARIASGATTEMQGKREILDAQQEYQVRLVVARAKTLADPAQIDAYRRQLKDAFAKGGLDGLTDWDRLDADLITLARQKDTALREGRGRLATDIRALLERNAGNRDSTAEWAALDARARDLGPAALEDMAIARDKMALRRRLDALPLDEGAAFLQRLDQAARNSAPSPLRSHLAPGRSETAVDRLAPGFQDALGAMFGALPAELQGQVTIASGYRSVERQAELWQQALDKYGSAEAARKWVAPPGNSRHNGGVAADLAFGSDAAKQWVHDNADRFGLHFRLDNEDWHIEPKDVAAAARGSTGMGPHPAAVIADGYDHLAARRQLVSTDPLAAAVHDDLTPQIAPVDFAAASDALAASFQARVAQAEAVATTYRRPVTYLRPDEKPMLQARLDKGGAEAIDTVIGLVRGAGPAAPAVLREIGDGAPALAHAAQVQIWTGDPAFTRQVAEAQAARAVPGSTPPTPKGTDVDAAMRTVLGPALQSLDAAETERTRSAVVAWTEREMVRRNIGFDQTEKMSSLLGEAIQRARGMTASGGTTFGGVGTVRYGPPMWSSPVRVQVPPAVRTDRFTDVLAAVTDDDLKALADPPAGPKGIATAADVRRLAPVYGPGGYRFVTLDAATGRMTPMMAASGRPFILPWDRLAPILRARVPDAFR